MFNEQRVIGILAHVDAGKTTLAEAILYTAGVLHKTGRVDHRDTFLDHFEMERSRGITIFSKQAVFNWKGMHVTLLDTPGHADFSAEMERTLSVLDYAVLVISAADGVQGHTRTLWALLKQYQIPTFLFVNKMDREGTDREALAYELSRKLDEWCVPFTDSLIGCEDPETFSLCSEDLMEEYLETGTLCAESIAEAIAGRRCFPVYFGSALKISGVETLLDGLAKYSLPAEYPEEFGARVYKISRDKQGNRLTHMKITGGVLKAKQVIGDGKADQIRLYHGQNYQTLQEAAAGSICAVTGLANTRVGDGIGHETGITMPSLEPVLTYQVKLPDGYDPVIALGNLRYLQEEEPLLHVSWNEKLREIHVSVMGEVQIEILQKLFIERFGLETEFVNGSIVYKETLAEPVLGVGHFEPLRHYAEVQLLIEPGEPGSGLQTASYVSEDELDLNWQRLILTHLEEKMHVGVLVGGELTDLRISIVAGKAHLKHTEGGDFRQATYRALRQGMRSGKSVLLEPVYMFTLELPTECIGRAMTDLTRMHAQFEPPMTDMETVVITGYAPVAAIRDYQKEVMAYSGGEGHLSLALKGYEPCKHAEEVIKDISYDPEADQDNPTSSVFCAHGAGFVVPWDEVYDYAHLPLRTDLLEAAKRWQDRSKKENETPAGEAFGASEIAHVQGNPEKEAGFIRQTGSSEKRSYDHISQEEIDAIFAQQRKNSNRKENDRRGYLRYHHRSKRYDEDGKRSDFGMSGGAGGVKRSGLPGKKELIQKEKCLLVDGYNVIYAWPELRELMKVNVGSARDSLIDAMSNYQGYAGGILILVFDAYKVKGNPGSVSKIGNIHVVYTKEAETADQYIEKTVHEMASHFQVTVATSDGLEQMIIWGDGATRMSSAGLREEYERLRKIAAEQYGSSVGGKIHFEPNIIT